MNFISEQKLGAFCAAASGLCYGLVGYFGLHIIHDDFSVSTMLFWRFFIAASLIGLVLVPQFKQGVSLDKQGLKVFFYGLLFYGTSTTLYFSASEHIGTGVAMVILFTFPALVMLINMVVYKATIRKMYYLALAVIFLGMIFLVDTGGFSLDVYGISISVLAAFLYACYIVFTKKATLPPAISALLVSMGCMCASLVCALFENNFRIPLDLSTWFTLVCMGLFCTALPILLFMQGLKYISSEKASMLSVLEPVFVVIFGVLLLGEQLSGTQMVGILIILSGAIGTLFIESPRIKEVVKEVVSE